MKLRMGKAEDESAEQPTGEQASSNDGKNLDKTESEVSGEKTPQSATESTPKEEEELRQVKTGQRELEIKNEIRGLVGENLQEKIRGFNKISKGPDIVDDNIKTEKFDDEE